MFFRKKSVLIIGLIISLWALCIPAVNAEGGDRANSPGIPGQKPLSFVSISLIDGSKVEGTSNIPIQPKFKLVFDKNIVNSLIWGRNSKCFTMVSSKNQSVPILVTKIDDTIDFSQRQNAFVEPASPLSPGTTYTLRVSPDLLAKNGVSTLGGTTGGKGIAITFRTMGQPAVEPTTQQSVQQSTQPKAGANQGKASQTTPKSGLQSAQKPLQQLTNEQTQVTSGSTKGVNSQQPAQVLVNKTTQNNNQQTTQSKVLSEPSVTPDANEVAESKSEGSAPKAQAVNYTQWVLRIAIVLIIGWIAAEVFTRWKKKK